MAFKIEFSEQAAGDLSEIIRYIRDDLCNSQAAERFYTAVNEKLGLLGEHPRMFPLYRDDKLRAEGYRTILVGNFLMFYLVNDEKAVVSIARILYGKRDVPSVFEESPDGSN